MSNPWNLDDGLKLVRALQQECRRYSYHLALGGGVLNNGESKKDIDLYFLPLDNKRFAEPNPTGLIDWLVKLWGPYEVIGENYGVADGPQSGRLSYDVETPLQPSITGASTPYQVYTLGGSSLTFSNIQETPGQPSLARTWFSSDSPVELAAPWQANPIEPLKTGSYKYKLKFNRHGDRIDVFIL